jgi:hypothetical protein
MTVEQIDAALASWTNRLAAIAENLLELQADPTYKALTGAGSTGIPLAGATSARVTATLGPMPLVFDHFALLHATVQRAATLRERLPTLFGVDAKLAEIEAILLGRSIELPAPDLSLSQRTLIAPLHPLQRVSLEELLEPMVRAFAAARDSVAAVGRAGEELVGAIARSEEQLRWFATQSAAPAVALKEAMQTLDQIRNTAATDPLGSLALLNTSLLPALAQIGKRVEADARLSEAIHAAGRQLDELKRLHAAGQSAIAEASFKIAGAGTLPAPLADSQLQSLQDWLERLDARRREGLVESVAIGLKKWNDACRRLAEQAQQVSAAHYAVLDQRRELRGRLDALKAKARAHGIAEAGAIVRLAEQAETLLYVQPTPLNQAATAVAQLEQALREPRAKVQS